MKRFMSLLIIVAIMLGMSTTAFAETGTKNEFENSNGSDININSVSAITVNKECRELSAKKQILEKVEELGLDPKEVKIGFTSGDISLYDVTQYKNVYGDKKIITKVVTPSGQPTNGTLFPTGGGFYYSLEGGGTTSVSVGFGGDFGTMSVSIPIGKVGVSTGYYVAAPRKDRYYRLKVSTKYEVTPYIIYKKAGNSWLKWYTGYTSSFYSQVPIFEVMSTI